MATIKVFIEYRCFAHNIISLLNAALMVSGGDPFSTGRKVEVISPSGEVSCSLPDLPLPRVYHTHDGNLLCGGRTTSAERGVGTEWKGVLVQEFQNCIKLTSSGWTVSHNLIYLRVGHSSWAVEDGVILLGGGRSPNTTEIVKLDGSTEELFPLRYRTK